MTTQFREDNTNGFSNEELTVLNTVFDRVCSKVGVDEDDRHADSHEKNVSDRINNFYVDGITADRLEAAVLKSFGVAA